MVRRVPLAHIVARLKFRQLEVFRTVVETGSISKAADKLNVTQPAVSRTVRELEELFETPLVRRTSRGVIATDSGGVLATHAGNIYGEIRDVWDSLNSLREADSGHVVVGVFVTGATYLIPRAIDMVLEKSPRVVVSIREGTNDVLLPELADGDIDLVVGRVPDTTYSGVTYTPLYDETMCVVASPSNALGEQQNLSLADLVSESWIMPIMQSPVHEVARRVFDQAGLAFPLKVVESLSMPTNINLLANSNMIQLMSTRVAVHYEELGMLKRLPMDPIGEFGTVGVATSDSQALNPAAAMMLDALKSCA